MQLIQDINHIIWRVHSLSALVLMTSDSKSRPFWHMIRKCTYLLFVSSDVLWGISYTTGLAIVFDSPVVSTNFGPDLYLVLVSQFMVWNHLFLSVNWLDSVCIALLYFCLCSLYFLMSNFCLSVIILSVRNFSVVRLPKLYPLLAVQNQWIFWYDAWSFIALAFRCWHLAQYQKSHDSETLFQLSICDHSL